jgi:hypothetical protein
MTGHIFHRITHTRNPIRLGIGNFNGKFIFNGHYHLYGIEGVQTKIFAKLGGGANFGWVDLVKVFNDGEDAFLDFGGGEEGGLPLLLLLLLLCLDLGGIG